MIANVPWLIPAAEVQDRGVLHHPRHGALSTRSHQVVRVFAGIVVPQLVRNLKGGCAVERAKQVLIGKEHLRLMVASICHHARRVDRAASDGHVHQDYARVEICPRGIQANLVDARNGVRRIQMRRRGERAPLKIGLHKRPQGIDYQHVRVKVQGPPLNLRKHMGRKKTVIHLLRIALACVGAIKQRAVYAVGAKVDAKVATIGIHMQQALLVHRAVQQVQAEALARVIDHARSHGASQRRQVRPIACCNELDRFVHQQYPPLWTPAATARPRSRPAPHSYPGASNIYLTLPRHRWMPRRHSPHALGQPAQ